MATTKKPAAKKTTTAKKTTAAKPAAKKATVTKKTTTAKPAAKKATAPKTTTKPTAKATATKKVATKKAVEISVTGNKKIDTLRKEFNKQFPYLRLGLYYSYMRNESTKTPLSGDKTLASVRRADSGGDISIAGKIGRASCRERVSVRV